ncbi:MAG: hypothetical protein ACREGF_01280 [Candidatus Saccharimonadales bacterium]
MGHYASEMDPDWGKPSVSELKLAEVEDEKVKNLAKALFSGFDSGSNLEVTNTLSGIQVAEAIDNLIKARLEEIVQAAPSNAAPEV